MDRYQQSPEHVSSDRRMRNEPSESGGSVREDSERRRRNDDSTSSRGEGRSVKVVNQATEGEEEIVHSEEEESDDTESDSESGDHCSIF